MNLQKLHKVNTCMYGSDPIMNYLRQFLYSKSL